MKLRTWKVAALASTGLLLLLAVPASARNPHCAGGIQYVVQAMRDKEKGNTEDYVREINKAVQQLEICSTEDPADYEAIGYLGWAYAEVESAGPAGKAFQAAMKGLKEKGDTKKYDMVASNLQSYWANTFNEGIEKIKAAQQTYDPYTKEPADDAEKTLKTEAGKQYQAAIAILTRASLLRPGEPQTLRNLGSVYAFMGDYQAAGRVLQDGLKQAPGDTTILEALRSVRVNYANQLAESKKYDEAIEYFKQLTTEEPNNADLWLSVADVQFRKATATEGEARKALFSSSGENYEKAHSLRPSDCDLAFNAALARQNAGEWDKSEADWRLVLVCKPNDVDALSSLGAVLAESKKYDEAVKVLHQAVMSRPEDKNLHRQLGAAYTKAENNAKATEELMVYLAMHNGKVEADAAAAAKMAKDGSGAAKTLATEGPPDQVSRWEADQQKYETWFYFKKHQAYTFGEGTLVTKSDWSSAVMKSAAAGAAKKK